MLHKEDVWQTYLILCGHVLDSESHAAVEQQADHAAAGVRVAVGMDLWLGGRCGRGRGGGRGRRDVSSARQTCRKDSIRVLARTSNIPVQNSDSKISACTNLATDLLVKKA